MNQRSIVIDGKTYKSVDEMPPDIRTKYEEAIQGLDQDRDGLPDMLARSEALRDKNRDGTPDAFEGLASTFQGSAPMVMNSTKILVNGQVYDGLDQLPPEVRAQYEQAMRAMDKNRNGIPDFVEGMLGGAVQVQTASTAYGHEHPDHSFFDTSKDRPKIVRPAIEPESSGGWMLALTGIAFAGFCRVAAAAGIWYFFLR